MTNTPSNEHDNHEDDELQASKRQKLNNETTQPSIDEGRDGSRDQNETSNNDTHDTRIGQVAAIDDDVAVSSLPLSSTPAAPSTTKPSTSTNSSSHSTIYIGGLDPRVLKVHLEKMLGRYGTIQRLHCVYRDSNRGPPNHGVAGRSPHHPQQHLSHNNNQNNNNNNHHQYWFAFCQMATVAQAEAAQRALDGQVLLGKHLVVRPANHDSATFSSHGAGMAPPTQVAAAAGASSSSQPPTTISASKLESQQRSLEDKISAIKRKLQQHQQNKL